ncbi:MAG TPA: 2OG-Fe(II) oxygenase [Kofleriaceae bacterium]|nr:2OG-Fe(II) oxygenase [Kofleriaceae bacterium]
MADVLPAFLSSPEIAELRERATASEGWTAGRQGTGYEILPLRAALPSGPGSLIARTLALLGTPFEDYWDVYLIRYRDGAHITPHVDDAQHGKRHRRINAVVAQADAGGELWIDGRHVALGVGDAVRFYPDRERHEVTPVTGTRLLVSVGAWIEPDEVP